MIVYPLMDICKVKMHKIVLRLYIRLNMDTKASDGMLAYTRTH